MRQTLAAEQIAILHAPPGAGKTTYVPLALRDEPWLQGKKILMLEPRRIAARNAARYMAAELGEQPGGSVGYRIRQESRSGPETHIEILTEGILTRMLQQDPALEDVGLVIFDEFHERNLHSDLALALCRDSASALREDLRILIMSATLDGQSLQQSLQAPVISSQGQSFPVDIHYWPPAEGQDLVGHMVRSIPRALAKQEGDVLVFLPGLREIEQCAEWLGNSLGPHVSLHRLHGNLAIEEQQRLMQAAPVGHRKLILATNIAESSLTIDGVRMVLDSGLQRRAEFDHAHGIQHLKLCKISVASATQRAGRAGRQAQGLCIRFWSEGRQQALLPFEPPQITQTDLVPLALEVALWGATVEDLPWLDAPPQGAYQAACQLLVQLGALDSQGRITAGGKGMLRAGLHPRFAAMLEYARAHGSLQMACDLAALLSDRDLLAGRRELSILRRWHILQDYRQQGRTAAKSHGVSVALLRRIEQQSHLYMKSYKSGNTKQQDGGDSQIAELLAIAYPDRIAMQRSADSNRYLLSNGHGALLAEHERLAEFYVVSELGKSPQGESRVYCAEPLARSSVESLFSGQIKEYNEVNWDGREKQVQAWQQQCLGALVLSRRPYRDADPEALAAAMLEGIRSLGLQTLPWNDEAKQLCARIEFLRRLQPDQSWPDCSEQGLRVDLEVWLSPYLQGVNRASQLGSLKLVEILKARLDWPQQQQLEQWAPSAISVPSGHRRTLDYTQGEAPVLAVKLQEMFGLADTPTVAQGQVAVLLHLLSPARRPIQITSDLSGFWHNTYAEVKKELKGRYPKHPWPDDPWSAQATARAKPRR